MLRAGLVPAGSFIPGFQWKGHLLRQPRGAGRRSLGAKRNRLSNLVHDLSWDGFVLGARERRRSQLVGRYLHLGGTRPGTLGTLLVGAGNRTLGPGVIEMAHTSPQSLTFIGGQLHVLSKTASRTSSTHFSHYYNYLIFFHILLTLEVRLA